MGFTKKNRHSFKFPKNNIACIVLDWMISLPHMKTFILNFTLLTCLAVQGCQTAQPSKPTKHLAPPKNDPSIGLTLEKNRIDLAFLGKSLETDPIMQGIDP